MSKQGDKEARIRVRSAWNWAAVARDDLDCGDREGAVSSIKRGIQRLEQALEALKDGS